MTAVAGAGAGRRWVVRTWAATGETAAAAAREAAAKSDDQPAAIPPGRAPVRNSLHLQSR